MKIVKYIVSEIFFIVFAILWADMLTNDHKPGEICITNEWGAQIKNYLEFGWNNYFHWFRKEEMAPCRYELYMMFFYYIPVFLAYSMLKAYGEKWNVTFLSFKTAIFEIVLYVLLYLTFILIQPGFEITLGSTFNALNGTIRFLSPLILYGLLISKVIKSQE